MSYRITYGQLGSEEDIYNPASQTWVVSAKLPMELNVSPVLTVELPPNHPLLHRMEAMSAEQEIRVYEDGEEIFRGRIITSQDDLDRLNTVEAESQQAYLNDVRVRPYTTYYTDDQQEQLPIVSGNLAQHLIEVYNAHCTAGREFSFLGSDRGDNLMVSQTSNPTVRDELNDKIYALGAWAEVTSRGQDRLIRFTSEPAEGEQAIELGKNLISYAHKEDYTGIITAIIAKGKRENESFGLEEIQDGIYGAIRIKGDAAIHTQGEATYGIIEEARTYEATTPSQLFALVERDLEAAVMDVSSLDVKAYDLHQSDASVPPLRLGRSYTVRTSDREVKMQLTSMELDICDPSQSEYHFGKKAASLSRSEASSASKSRGEITQLTQRANSTNKKLLDGLDELGDGLVDVEHLYSGFDEKLDGMDEAIEIAKQEARNTAYGVCSTGAGVRAKAVTVAYPQGGTFALKDGAVVSVRFTNANQAANPTLNVSGTGARSIVTNGSNEAIWQAGQTVLFTYLGGNWCTMSAPVWTESVVVGDPRYSHLDLNSKEISMSVGSNKYFQVDSDGLQVGYTAILSNGQVIQGSRNIHIGSSEIALRQGQTNYMTLSDSGIVVGVPKSNYYKAVIDNNGMRVTQNVDGDTGLIFGYGELSDGGSGYIIKVDENQLTSLKIEAALAHVYLGVSYSRIGTNALLIDAYEGIALQAGYTNYLGFATVVVNPGGKKWAAIPARRIAYTYGSITDYAFMVTNGDVAAIDCPIIGTGVDRSTQTLYVYFDREVDVLVRLNIFGVPCGFDEAAGGDPPSTGGPEIFGDPSGTGPQIFDDGPDDTVDFDFHFGGEE